jgi:hypothetical protein
MLAASVFGIALVVDHQWNTTDNRRWAAVSDRFRMGRMGNHLEGAFWVSLKGSPRVCSEMSGVRRGPEYTHCFAQSEHPRSAWRLEPD